MQAPWRQTARAAKQPACTLSSCVVGLSMLRTLSCLVYWSMLGSGPQRTGMSRARRAIGSRTLRSRVAHTGRVQQQRRVQVFRKVHACKARR